MRFVFLFFLFISALFAINKTPSDVYSESKVVNQMLQALRVENGVDKTLEELPIQKNKLPRHVLQKSIEVLRKVDKYREIHGLGRIAVPPVPPRDITPQDVYNNIERLKQEVLFLLSSQNNSDKKFKYKQYNGKTPSDVYRELWMISIGFDALLGQGFTPTDVYAQSQQVVDIIKFLRVTQREKRDITKPLKKHSQHPNHALYKSVELIKQINSAEKKLWMKAVPIPNIEEKVISPTEVYDSLQTVIAELNRISRRLGVERTFELKEMNEKKSPADVVQNLEYAIALLPEFKFSKELNQYPKSSLLKTPNDVFGLSEYILSKIEYIKVEKGIQTEAKETRYIYGLKPIHVYEKGIENLEKIAKLKKLEGFKPSQVPDSASKTITPSEVYELILRLDDELSLIYQDTLSQNPILDSYRELAFKTKYKKKTPSDAYDNLWKISYELDAILNEEYTPNETYILSRKIENDISQMAEYFLGKPQKLHYKKFKSKRPKDVFLKSLEILKELEFIKSRGNFKSAKITIPQDEIISPTSVYNALRIISATISEIDVYYDIPRVKVIQHIQSDKTPTDVYTVLEHANRVIDQILEEKNYEN